MTKSYDWVLHSDAVEFFQRQTKRRRATMLRALQSLSRHPFVEPKIRAQDSAKGDFSVIVIDGIAMTYHVDHAVRLVHVFRFDGESPLS